MSLRCYITMEHLQKPGARYVSPISAQNLIHVRNSKKKTLIMINNLQLTLNTSPSAGILARYLSCAARLLQLQKTKI